MKKHLRGDLEDWQTELFDAARDNIAYWQSVLDNIASGGRIEVEDVGDITEDERRKAVWYIATYRSQLAKLEYDHANENNVPADAELSEILQADW